MRRRACKFCADEKVVIDYKNAGLLKYFITDRGKLVPRRLTGNCAKHQRAIARNDAPGFPCREALLPRFLLRGGDTDLVQQT